MRVCEQPLCNNVHFGRGMCKKHHSRWVRHGDPTVTTLAPKNQSASENLVRGRWDVTKSGCWEWRGMIALTGYGVVSAGHTKQVLAHRAAFEHWVRGLEPGEHVRHKCDNPPCINPDHLESGSRKDNMQDMLLRDRAGMAVLTVADVPVIRDAHATGLYTYKRLGEVYGVSASCICSLVRRRTWTHV